MSDDGFRIVPANTVPFADVEAVFGTRGDAAHCWCQWYKVPKSEWPMPDDDLRRRLSEQLAEPASNAGLLAYDGATPVGWCAIEPRMHLPRLRRSRLIADGSRNRDLDDPDVWSLTCFVVPREHRRRGVAGALADAAVEHARQHGARTIEGYAIDPAARTNVAAADLFVGTVTMFVGAGFEVVARPTQGRAVMEARIEA
ncbi:GNAT family N-acetyltransferase [Agromyces sp. MMS24-JH15]|uniref:GNAT family N-acetyltransferase n=1 Tax=Agromyces sp. MMS24-JH15 TaxID=3243765 RepID=UPI003747B33D